MVENIKEEMIHCIKQDIIDSNEGRPAVCKLKAIDEIGRKLKQVISYFFPLSINFIWKKALCNEKINQLFINNIDLIFLKKL